MVKLVYILLVRILKKKMRRGYKCLISIDGVEKPVCRSSGLEQNSLLRKDIPKQR